MKDNQFNSNSSSLSAQNELDREIPSLSKDLENYFSIGAAVEPYQLTGVHKEVLEKHFNVIVAENVMKPLLLSRAEGQFDWENSDRIVAFAKENKMEIRFHTLAWHNQTPDWFFEDSEGNGLLVSPENKELLLNRLEKYITTVCERYKDDISCWDVVNEVIDPDEEDGLRKSKWFELTGTDFIETAFYTARRVLGTDAKLYVNDYNTHETVKREKLFKLVKQLLAKGVPIDGVGHQMHISLEWPTVETISETLDMFSELGLDNQITEMDISMYSNGTDKKESFSQETLDLQGERYKEIFDLFKQKKDQISQVVTWGIGDDHTWKKGFPIERLDLPLIFDEQLKPKPAFWQIVGGKK